MKNYILIWKMFFLALLCVIFIFSCTKKEDSGGNSNPGGSNPAGSGNADSLSDRLQFISASKKQGKAPQAPGGNALKVSFKDTLYLLDQVEQPIKFLHTDTTKNVAGVYLQVQVGLIGGPVDASYYYDVPETPTVSESDTVSEILIGFDPTGYKPPVSFNITIIPYDENKNPIESAIRPVEIVEHKNNPAGTGNGCSLVLPLGDYWDWYESRSWKTGPGSFHSSPDIIFGKDGQIIRGSCCSGVSVYPQFCPKDTAPNASLHFPTFYQIASETFTFLDNGTYVRRTTELGANPLPVSSNFCGGGEGVVSSFNHSTTYTGGYIITSAVIPPDLKVDDYFNDDSTRLAFVSSSSTPPSSGFGNPGGVIHWMDCEKGYLLLVQIDIEGAGQHLLKFYRRRSLATFDRWFAFAV